MKFVIVYSLSFLMFLFTFFVAKIKEKHDLLDILWGLAFIVPSVLSLILNGKYNIVNIVLSSLVLIWGLRLTYHIFIRNSKSNEDFRYLKYREEYNGKCFDFHFFFKMYVLQYILSIIISFQVVYSNIIGLDKFTYLTAIGLLIWIVGYLFESIGDRQLRIFKSDENNNGKIMNKGLWRYTRHPNYFGESTMWWGIYLIAISNYKNYFLIFSPIVITFLLRFVSGVPLLEKKYDGMKECAKKENWKKYKEETNIFIPMFKRH